jgi:hypothetical protein
VTLHVGAGTFLPVRTDNIENHIMHSEWCDVPEQPLILFVKPKHVAIKSLLLVPLQHVPWKVQLKLMAEKLRLGQAIHKSLSIQVISSVWWIV